MSDVKLYKGNSRSTGSVTTFNIGPADKDGDIKGEIAVYISTLLQASWNELTKKPSFKENAKNPAKQLRLKINEFEVGNLVNAIKRRVEFKGYHTHAGRQGQVQFSFTPSVKDGVFQGFFYSALRDGKEKFSTPITAGEAERLLAFFDFYFKNLDGNRYKARIANIGTRTQPSPEPELQQAASEPPAEDPFVEPPVAPEETATPEADENPFG